MIAAAAAMLLAAAQAPPVYRWFWLAHNKDQVSFGDVTTLEGPRNARVFLLENILKRKTAEGGKFSFTLMRIDCDRGTYRYLRRLIFNADGKFMTELDPNAKSSGYIVPGTAGADARSFACGPLVEGLPDAIPVMLPPSVVTDQYFRLLQLGLSDIAAQSIAAVDPVRAPAAYKKLMAVFVPIDLQELVRALKTPDAPDTPLE